MLKYNIMLKRQLRQRRLKLSIGKKIFKKIKHFFLFLKKLLTFNITTIMFGVLLLYMIITVILYTTSSHVTSYQVTVGPLTKNPVCNALALREEQIVPAGGSGYIDYYAREGMQVRKNGSVYALDNEKTEASDIKLSAEQLEKMRATMEKFSYGFQCSDFYDTYSFKYELQGSILHASGIMEQQTATSNEDTNEDSNVLKGQAIGESVSLGNQKVFTSPEAGVVVYSSDGYEEKTPDDLKENDFDEKAYKKTELLTNKKVKKGEPVYKVITSEEWTLMVPLTEKLAATIADRSSIKVKFLKDGETQNGALSISTIGDQKIAQIDLKNGMARYASDRFLEIELVVNTRSGLKIPVSSIITKEFYLIPRDFLANGNNTEGKGFIRELQHKNKAATTEFVEAIIYKEVDAEGNEITYDTADTSGGYCYVDKKTFHESDVLIKPDSNETFVVGEVDYLEGVYGMNKGYAVFRQIEILDQNEAYCIVKQGTSYGLQPFDYIVLEGETVQEEDILSGTY